MKTKFTETIDGSIKSILQLKTLDNSLEFSQMFDALQDTPRDFQFKLMDALNSLGQTMEIPPTECFDKVLCASDDENPDVKKKMYNWWRAFFEILGKVVGNMPKVRSAEFTEKVDALMAEIMKSGDAESTEDAVVMESTKPRFKKGDFVVVRNGDDARVLGYYRDRVDKTIWYQVWVMDGNRTTEFPDEDVYASREEYEAKYLYEEDYEEADKAEEDDMLKDFDFAVQHIGEIANKVKDIVNFVNPYCESVGGTSKMNEDEVREFVKSIGFRPDSDGIDYETQLVDALTGKDTSYNAGWGAVYYNSDKVLQFLKKYGMLGSRGIKQKEAISKLRRLFKSGKWKSPQQDELFNEVDNTMNENEADALDAKDISKLVWDSQDDEMEVLESYPPKKDGSVKFDVFIKNNGQLGERVSIDDIVGLAEGVFGDILRGTGWEFEVVPANEDNIVEMWNGADFDGKVDVYNDQTRLGDSDGATFQITCIKANGQFNEVDNTMKKTTNERRDSDWVPMNDIVGMEVGESDEEPINWDDEDTYNDGGFERGMWVIWTDPDGGEESVWKILKMPESEDDLFVLGQKDGSINEVYGWEIRPRDSDPAEYNESGLENELPKGDDGWREIGHPVGEATVTVDADDIWEVLDLLNDETANKNLTDLINSHTRSEEEIMDAIENLLGANGYSGEVPRAALNGMFSADNIGDLIEELGLDVEAFMNKGEFVDPQKPVALEGSDDNQKPDEVKGAEKKYKQDGETKTLVTGSDKEINNKQEVTEMTIEQEIGNPWKLSELMWGQGKENLEELLRAEVVDEEALMQMLEDMEIHDLTAINDAFAYDFESILDMVGCDPHAWSQNLEIKKKGDEDSEED